METLVIILAVGALNVACFFIGAKVGQTVSRGEPIETPTVNPFKIIEHHREERHAAAEQDRIDAILKNIESYDGTGHGQQDVPR